MTETRKLASVYVKKCYDEVKLLTLSNDLELPGHPKFKFFRDGLLSDGAMLQIVPTRISKVANPFSVNPSSYL